MTDLLLPESDLRLVRPTQRPASFAGLVKLLRNLASEPEIVRFSATQPATGGRAAGG